MIYFDSLVATKVKYFVPDVAFESLDVLLVRFVVDDVEVFFSLTTLNFDVECLCLLFPLKMCFYP